MFELRRALTVGEERVAESSQFRFANLHEQPLATLHDLRVAIFQSVLDRRNRLRSEIDERLLGRFARLVIAAFELADEIVSFPRPGAKRAYAKRTQSDQNKSETLTT